MRYLLQPATCLAAVLIGHAAFAQSPAAPPTPPTDELADSSADAGFLAQKIANRYGIGDWDQVQHLEFTFNVQPADQDRPTVSRSWAWNNAEQHVTRTVDGREVGIALADDPQQQDEQWKQVHRQFINDSYWLLFPFYLVWSDPVVTVSERPQLMPMGGQTADRYTAQWPAEGGYTPGDAYDLYVDPDTGLIRQWAFRKGGAMDNPRPMTWDNHQRLGPLLVSLDHHGPADEQGRATRLFFTGVAATLADGSTVRPGSPLDADAAADAQPDAAVDAVSDTGPEPAAAE